MVKVPTGLGLSAAPTATGYTRTTRSFSTSASLRSGMLTTTRRVVVVGTEVAGPLSAAFESVAHAATIAIAAAVLLHPALLVLMSPSLISGVRKATLQPAGKSFRVNQLTDFVRRRTVSPGRRCVRADTCVVSGLQP